MQFLKSLLYNSLFDCSKYTSQNKNECTPQQYYNSIPPCNIERQITLKHLFDNNSAINNTTSTLANDNKSNPFNCMVFGYNSVEEAIQQQLNKITPLSKNYDPTVDGNSFFIGDLGELHRQYLKWKTLLPRIEPFYAVKCNPDPIAIQYLASLGVGFDCASKMELQQVLESGVNPNQIIYAQPVKQPSFLYYAATNNVSLMTFDNEDELYKIKEIYPEAKLVLRILVDDSYSVIPLGSKYGASLDTLDPLLKTVKDLGLTLIGVSFHVGSGCFDGNAYHHALVRARHVFDRAKTFGYQLTLLDVGGGFNDSTVVEGATFEKVAAILGPAVNELFPSKNVRVIAEPGRYFVGGPAYTFCLGIIGRRIESKENHKTNISSNPEKTQVRPNFIYYINDGFYGTFQMPILDQLPLNIRVLRKKGINFYGRDIVVDNKETLYPCTLWGPTCCPLDRVQYNGCLPELHTGDWLYLENFGAYTIAGASTFNGYEKPTIIHVNSFYDS